MVLLYRKQTQMFIYTAGQQKSYQKRSILRKVLLKSAIRIYVPYNIVESRYFFTIKIPGKRKHLTIQRYYEKLWWSRSLRTIVGLLVLNNLSEFVNKEDIGLYRDDGLLVLLNKSGRAIDKKRKEIVKIFKDIGFQIDIENNLKVANILDITLDLNNNIYRP